MEDARRCAKLLINEHNVCKVNLLQFYCKYYNTLDGVPDCMQLNCCNIGR